MGKAIKGTSVKVEGQAGPLGKGMPLAQAVGSGGAASVAQGQPIQPNTQAPGFKGLMKRAGDSASSTPGIGTGVGVMPKSNLFSRMFAKNPEMQKRLNLAFQKKQQANKYGGMSGMFRKAYDQKQANLNAQAPGQVQPTGGVTQLGPPTHGGLVSKQVL